MSAAELARRIRIRFVKDKCRPIHACTLQKTGCNLDSRRWDGRSSEGCKKFWERIRADCTRFKGCHDRVLALKLTGNPSDADIMRCADFIFSEGSTAMSHLYDCVRNEHYHIAHPLKYKEAYSFLLANTTLLNAADIRQNDDESVDGRKETDRERKLNAPETKAAYTEFISGL